MMPSGSLQFPIDISPREAYACRMTNAKAEGGQMTDNPRITLVWNNGEITTGDTWREVEDNVRATQWVTYSTRHAFRNDMRKRAFVWSGQHAPKTSTSSRDFIQSLARCNLFLVTIAEEENRSA